MTRPALTLELCLCLLAASLSACGTSKPLVLQTQILVEKNANPDARGRPSPVILRLYELRSLAAFDSTDFLSLYDKEKETLAGDLVARDEFQLRPDDQRSFERKIQPDTRFIGVVAAFRDLNTAQWRTAAPVSGKKTMPLTIMLTGNSVSLVTKQ